MQVMRFVETAGPHILLHLQRGAQMSGKADQVKALTKQFQTVTQIQDKLRAKLQKDQEAQQKQQKEAARVQGQMMSDEQLKRAAFVADEERKNAKVSGDIQRKEKKAKQDLALKDAKTAAGIRLKKQQSAAQAAAASSNAKKNK